MSTPQYTRLEGRGLLSISGEDRIDFLQGLISNDVTNVSPDQSLYGAMLTAQGKFLHDFFIFAVAEDIFLDCEAARLDDLKKRLTMYKLRAKVEISDRSDDFNVYGVFGKGVTGALGLNDQPGATGPFGGGIACMDPRLTDIGARALLTDASALDDAGCDATVMESYEQLRLKLGLADGSRDMIVDKAILLENGFEELNGVSWDKGCYTGQELTARTHYRGLIKKRLMPVHITGPMPTPGTAITLGDAAAGEMRSGSGDVGVALIRLEQFRTAIADGKPLQAGEASLMPTQPDWASFPEPASED